MIEAGESVVNVAYHRLAPDNRPSWCELSGIGVFRIRPNASFDPHFHDFAEYWMFCGGKGKVSVGEEVYYVQAGDVVCTPAPATHDILEICEELEAFYFEEAAPTGGRLGQRHRNEQDAGGHLVPLVQLPVDFPSASRAGVFGS